MPKPVVWVCFAEIVKPSDKALSNEVENLKPIRPAKFWKMDSTANVFFGNFLELFKIFVPWKFIYSKVGVQLRQISYFFIFNMRVMFSTHPSCRRFFK